MQECGGSHTDIQLSLFRKHVGVCMLKCMSILHVRMHVGMNVKMHVLIDVSASRILL